MTTIVKNGGWVNPISISVLLIPAAILIVLFYFELITLSVLLGGLLLFIILSASIRVADQWERAVVLRMGKYKGLKGPGPFLIVPIIDHVSTYIDQRVRVSAFKAEQTLTKDTVPVNVDAVVYWTVWDVEKAALEVQEYQAAIEHIAQTGLRDVRRRQLHGGGGDQGRESDGRRVHRQPVQVPAGRHVRRHGQRHQGQLQGDQAPEHRNGDESARKPFQTARQARPLHHGGG